jgi:hypothetical protein
MSAVDFKCFFKALADDRDKVSVNGIDNIFPLNQVSKVVLLPVVKSEASDSSCLAEGAELASPKALDKGQPHSTSHSTSTENVSNFVPETPSDVIAGYAMQRNATVTRHSARTQTTSELQHACKKIKF